MLDLSTSGVGTWLKHNGAYDFRELPGAVQRAEANPNVETALVALGLALEEASSRDPANFKTRLQTEPAKNAFLAVLSQLGHGRLIRLLDWLSEPGKPDRHVLLAALFSADAPDPAQAVRASIHMLARQVLIRRLMHRDRLETLFACCKQYQLHHTNQKAL
jgi:hypothetical protein